MSVPPPSTAPAAPNGFEWWSPFAALFTAVAVATVFSVILAGVIGNAHGDQPASVILIGSYIQDALLVVAMVGFASLTLGRVTPATFGLRRVPPGRVLLVAGAAFVLFYVFLIAWAQLQPDAKDDLLDDLGAKDSFAALAGVAVLVCIVAPVVEELFFRGFLFPALGRIMHWIPAALLAGAVFGGIHAGGTPAIFLVPLAVLGFRLCLLYRRTGSLLPGMGVHAFNNALTLGIGLSWSFAGVVAALVVAPLVVVTLAGVIAE